MSLQNSLPLIISAFADEAVEDRTIADPHQQLTAVSALGLRYYTIRAINFTGRKDGNVNVINLPEGALVRQVELNKKYDMEVGSLGTPIGKSGLVEGAEAKAPFKPIEEVLEDLDKAFRAGDTLGTRLIRGFSFYPPEGAKPERYYELARDWLGRIAGRCEKRGYVYGVEQETNLVGRTAAIVTRLVNDIGSQNVVAIYDGANAHVQGLNAVAEFRIMAEVVGWMHVKDYAERCKRAIELDEKALRHFCPADIGSIGHDKVVAELYQQRERISKVFDSLGIPGIFMVLEPHLLGGGQFGGYSGARGMGVALKGLVKVLDRVGVDYQPLASYREVLAQKESVAR